jgi:hypothetical protein
MKTVHITFFDVKGIVHFEFILQGQTVNQVYYVQILKQLRETVCRKGPELWPNDWIINHGKELSVKQFLAQKSIIGIEHPTYSPDLAPDNFWLL